MSEGPSPVFCGMDLCNDLTAKPTARLQGIRFFLRTPESKSIFLIPILSTPVLTDSC